MRSLYDKLEVSQLLIPAVYNSDQNSSSLDLDGYGSAMFLVDLGNSADTLNSTNKIEIELEESANDSDFTDVADADVQDSVTATNTGTIALINAADEDSTVVKGVYIGNKRYVRCVLNFSGTHSTGTPIGIVGILGHADIQPV